jgi:glucose uptake protein GlcU
VNTRYEILDWFRPSREIIALRPVLMYYAIEIDSSLFLSVSFQIVFGMSSEIFMFVFSLFWLVLDVYLSSLFIVGEPPHRV